MDIPLTYCISDLYFMIHIGLGIIIVIHMKLTMNGDCSIKMIQ